MKIKKESCIYDKGDMVTLRKPGATLRTLALPQRGSYKVLKHYHENGSIKIKLEPNVLDNVNICRCYPYYSMPEQDEQNSDVNTQQAMDQT